MKNLYLFILLILCSCTDSKSIANNKDLFPDSSIEINIDYSKTEKILDISYSLDRKNINSFVQNTISSNNIDKEIINNLNLLIRQEPLYSLNFYAYYYDKQWHLINDHLPAEFEIEYVATIEIGFGMLPVTITNGNTCTQIYREDIVLNENTIGILRVWDLHNIYGGDFVFILFDKNMEIYYKYLSWK